MPPRSGISNGLCLGGGITARRQTGVSISASPFLTVLGQGGHGAPMSSAAVKRIDQVPRTGMAIGNGFHLPKSEQKGFDPDGDGNDEDKDSMDEEERKPKLKEEDGREIIRQVIYNLGTKKEREHDRKNVTHKGSTHGRDDREQEEERQQPSYFPSHKKRRLRMID